MTDLQTKLAALPDWPEPISNFDISVRDYGWWQTERGVAALARLALAREWIASQPHGVSRSGTDCLSFRFTGQPCTCGRDALLAALEVPR